MRDSIDEASSNLHPIDAQDLDLDSLEDEDSTSQCMHDIELDKENLDAPPRKGTIQNRIADLVEKLGIEDERKEEFKTQAYVMWVKIKKWLTQLKLDKSLLRQNQRMLSLKYHKLRSRYDFVQISVIAVASCITFIESANQYFELPIFFTTVFPIMLSTYIGFIIAVARFYKWDDTKETLTKMNEKLAVVINQLWQKIKFGTLHKNIEPTIDWMKYFENINIALDDFEKDGLDDSVIQLKQEIDIIMNYQEKLYYKNILANLSLKDAVIQKKIQTVDEFKQELLLSSSKMNRYLHPIKKLFRIPSYFNSNVRAPIMVEKFWKERLFKKKDNDSGSKRSPLFAALGVK